MNMDAQPPTDNQGHIGETLSAQLSLELPSVQYIESFFEAMAEFEAEGDHQYSKTMTREEFPAYVQQLHDKAEGKNLKEGHIADKGFWIVDAEGYAGRIILGLSYYHGPERVGNHVGYAVRPSKRRRGYATKALQFLLNEARELKIDKLMPTCDASNVASRKVIETNGGVLLESVNNDNELRFLIDLEHRIGEGRYLASELTLKGTGSPIR